MAAFIVKETEMHDEHRGCREEIERIRSKAEESHRVSQVVQEFNSRGGPALRVLEVLRVDWFEDGYRILVR